MLKLSKPIILLPYIFSLGICSGMPFALLAQSLQAWFTVTGASLVLIGGLGAIPQIFALKFLWAPLFDHFRLPHTTRRRGWLMLLQLGLFLGIGVLAFFKPQVQSSLVIGLAVLLAFLSASQDVVIDAWRTELLPAKWRGLGAAIYVGGYRVGMLVAGGWVLLCAAYVGWATSFISIASVFLLAIWLTASGQEQEQLIQSNNWQEAFIAPIRELWHRPGIVLLVLLFFTYKVSDHTLSMMLMPFVLRELHYSLTQVTMAVQIVGFIASLLGMVTGGIFLARFSLYRSLLYFAILQALTVLLFIWLAYLGPNAFMLYLSLSGESFCNGLGTGAVVAMMMAACHPSFTASQFAIFSAFTHASRILLAPIVGVIVLHYGYVVYFVFSFLIAIPSIVLVYFARHVIHSFEYQSRQVNLGSGVAVYEPT